MVWELTLTRALLMHFSPLIIFLLDLVLSKPTVYLLQIFTISPARLWLPAAPCIAAAIRETTSRIVWSIFIQ
jgi:hypothetical protein